MVQNVEEIKFLKVRDVKSPERAHPTDAGIDFFVPKFNKKFIADLKTKNSLLFENNEGGCCNSSGIMISSNTTLKFTNSEKEKGSEVIYDLNDENETCFKFDESEGKLYFLLAPHQRVLIPSGIHSRMSNPQRALIAANKSGVANSYGLIFGSQVVDYSYQGEIHISVINTSTKVVRIYEDMKLIQFIETPIITNIVKVLEENEIELRKGYTPNMDSYLNRLQSFYEGMVIDRKDGGFGSSNKNK